MTHHIADSGKMPWGSEPTPLADESAVEEYSPRLKLYVDLETARGLERRMRAAERLLARCQEVFADPVMFVMPEVDAHLEAARKEDEE